MRRISRRRFLQAGIGVSAAAVLGLTACEPGVFSSGSRAFDDFLLERRSPDSASPNVLFISLDDLNDWVGFLANHPGTHTPNLDSLAAECLVFDRAYAAAPACMPARCSVLSAQSPLRSGVDGHTPEAQDRHHELWHWSPSLIDDFWAAGYDCLGSGKIFHGDQMVQRWSEFKEVDFFLPGWLRSMAPPGWTGDPSWISPYTGEPIGDGSGFWLDQIDFGPSGMPIDAHPDTIAADWCRARLTEPRSRPFFVAFGPFMPHSPWRVPQQFIDLHPLEGVVVPPVRPEDLDDLSDFARESLIDPHEAFERLQGSGLHDEAVQHYQAAISYMDHLVGRVLDDLWNSGRVDDTIIMLWSDHGFHIGEKLHVRKGTLWERATRVPFLLRVPGRFDTHQVFDKPVSLLDVAPTLADLCDFRLSGEHDGESLLPIVDTPELADERPPIMTWDTGNHAVRRGRWRYIRYASGDRELYDLESDPTEFVNLAGDPQHATVESELEAFLPA